MSRIFLVIACASIAGITVSGQALAEGPGSAGPVCDVAEAGVITVDGLLDEWRGTSAHDVRGLSRDASFSVRCARDVRRLYVAIAVRDQKLVRRRGKQARARQEDNLHIRLSAIGGRAGELQVFPGVDGIEPVRTWRGGALPGWLEIEDTLQENGWSVELSVPLGKVPRLGKGAPGLKARVSYWDADGPGQGGKRDAATFDGMLTFRAAADLFTSFLQATNLSPGDVRMDVFADVDGATGVERVVAGGTVLGVLGEGFGYLTLPVQSARDVSRVEVVDLRGDGISSILTVLRQHGNGGSRDLLVVWGVSGRGTFERILAAEVRKEMGGKVLANRWSLVPKGALRGEAAQDQGRDLLIEVSEADVQGWSADSFREVPAADAHTILVPWSGQTSAVFSFEGNTALGGEPKVESPRRRR